ncbi:hypothetical protein UFOVP32_34 [uncultured Caudovirales phage]|uniref:Uncharacterized protein n=1 Tax=uncultured Caudovirales phage TaxID=2100421 RepID=A0A6J5KS03_9CAUD|nr:hypothetical protein UFOVP32_34 [uncultured Caudovirales phage]CAB4123687.1 hypothetical protein UFOVP50_42 [uncultured Caudovirales phage]
MNTQATFGPFTIPTLTANVGNLCEKDRTFAASLLASYDRCAEKGWSLSPKQGLWLAILAERAKAPAKPQAQAERVGSLDAINAMFDAAGSSLKRPAITLHVEALGAAIRLTVAGSQSKAPGAINVTSTGSFEAREWHGRIGTDGTFLCSGKIAGTDTGAAITAALRAFAADPKGEAAKHGQLTGGCCFCARPLKDKVSLAVGYGPVCAGKFGLPYGTLAIAA